MHPSILGVVERPLSNAPAGRRIPSASKKLFLPGELPAEFFALLAKTFEHYRPPFLSDASAVADSVRAHWMCLRHSRALTAFDTKLYRRKPDPAQWTTVEVEQRETLKTHGQRAQNAFHRSLKKIQHLLVQDPSAENSVQDLHAIYQAIFDLEGYPYHFG